LKTPKTTKTKIKDDSLMITPKATSRIFDGSSLIQSMEVTFEKDDTVQTPTIPSITMSGISINQSFKK